MANEPPQKQSKTILEKYQAVKEAMNKTGFPNRKIELEPELA